MKSESSTAIDQAEYGEDVTRCICGNEEFVSTPRTKALNAEPGLYVQCERCNVWQHGFCMGFETEGDIPNEYYCEKCEPLFHRIGQRQGVLQSRYRPYTPRNGNSNNGNGVNGSSTSKRSKNISANENANEENNGTAASTDSTDAINGSQRQHKIQADSTDTDGNSDARSSPAKLVNIETYPKQEIEEEPSTPSSQSVSQGGDHSSESRKRQRQRKSDTELTASFARNRKRRSREDLILQRVLEQSAKEAREAEARRREQEGLPPLEEEAVSSNGDRSSAEPEQEEQPTKTASKNLRNRSKIIDTPDETLSGDSEVSTNGSKETGNGKRQTASRQNGTKQNKTTARAPRNGRRTAARTAVTSSDESPSKRGAGGNKKCKPRIPSPRSTLSEMRRRVGSILDFTSRTQAELVEEKNVNISSLSNAAKSSKFGSELKLLDSVCSGNMNGLEQLTQKLLQWEEQYGVHSP